MPPPIDDGLVPHRGRRGQPRCERCAAPSEECLCEAYEPLELATRVVVLMHRREVHKTTNTGRLAALALRNVEVRVVGLPEDRVKLDGLAHDRAALLYPSGDALELAPELAAAGPLTLVVPDGNWRQAFKLAHKEPQLAALRRVRLPDGPPARAILRRHPDGRMLSTFEALARALGVLEGPAVQARLEAWLERKATGVLRRRRAGPVG